MVSCSSQDTQSTTSASRLGASGKGTELACSQVATVPRLLKETLTMVGRDFLQPARVSLKMGRKSFLYLVFSCPSPAA
jgi:hypothetical protein